MTEFWRGDGETADKKKEWAKQTVAADNRIQISGSPVSQGQYSYRVELQPGDNPSGCRATLASGMTSQRGWSPAHLIKNGDEAYYGFSIYLPSDTFKKLDKWRLLLQFKGQNSGSPPIALNVSNDTWLLNSRPTVKSSNLHIWKAPVIKDAWEKFMMHVKWSTDPKVGFIELYYNGQLVLPQLYTSTIHVKDGKPVTNFVALGIYRDSSISVTDVVYHDGFVAGQSYEEVAQ
jgi:hypothetical protein